MDMGASVIAKLKNKAQNSGMSFQVHLSDHILVMP